MHNSSKIITFAPIIISQPTTKTYVMDIEQLREYILSLPHVTEDMPFGDDCIVFRISGKIFACLSLTGDKHVAIKLSPDRNNELRAEYSDIEPAWHWNKKHWSDIHYERSLPDSLVKSLLSESHNLVFSSLPKRIRESLQSKISPIY